MLFRLLALVVLLGLCSPSASGQTPDSSSADSSANVADDDWLVLPFASFSPQTQFSGGMVAGWYGAADGHIPPSSVQTSITVTQRRQIILSLAPEVYLAEGRWRLNGELGISKFPSSFFGVGGDTPSAAEEDYTSRSIRLDGSVQRSVDTFARLGGRLMLHASTISEPDSGGVLAADAVPGADGTTVLGVGPTLFVDTRDNLYFPTHGTFADLSVVWTSALWGSEATFARWIGDVRAYRSWGDVVLATNAYTEAVVGTVPFELLPRLGGDVHMRGYRTGRYRDNVYWATQAEARLPLFWRFRMTVFANAGEVGPRIGSDLFSGIQTAVGLGGRLRLTDDGVHGRVDLAYGAHGPQIYLSLGEAF